MKAPTLAKAENNRLSVRPSNALRIEDDHRRPVAQLAVGKLAERLLTALDVTNDRINTSRFDTEADSCDGDIFELLSPLSVLAHAGLEEAALGRRKIDGQDLIHAIGFFILLFIIC